MRPKLQALVYNILPSTTAAFSYAIGSRKLSANEHFVVVVLLLLLLFCCCCCFVCVCVCVCVSLVSFCCCCVLFNARFDSYRGGVSSGTALLRGWCLVKLLPSRRVLCTPYNQAPCQVTPCKVTYVGGMRVSSCCNLPVALLAE